MDYRFRFYLWCTAAQAAKKKMGVGIDVQTRFAAAWAARKFHVPGARLCPELAAA